MGESATVAGWTVPLSDLVVDDEILEAVRDAVASGWWSMGPRVQELEQAFSDLCGSRFAFAVANGTAALQLALHACDIGPGDEVVLPSLNFVAAANTIVHQGATPVFCDIQGECDLNLDISDLEAAIGPRTKAIVVLHYGGFPCDMDEVLAVAERHGVTVVEDAAHAPGASWAGRACGTFGRVGCFSFFSNKNLPVGEGGMVVTDDPELADRLRLLRSHGMTTLTWDRHRGHAASYDVVVPGHNFRLDEIRAAIALVQLARLESGNLARGARASRYAELLADVDGLVVPFTDSPARSVSAHHLAVVLLPPEFERDRVQAQMKQDGIQTSVHYPPIHGFTAYRTGAGAARELPTTDAVADRLLTLPLYPHLSDLQVEAVAASLRASVAAQR